MSREPAAILTDALNHFTTMLGHAQRDLEDQLVIDAVCMRLSAGIEVLATLDPATRDSLFSDWPLMWGMRNRIAHGYLLIDAVVIRATLLRDMTHIVSSIQGALDAAAPRR